MMRHYVSTISCFDGAYPLDSNERRLEVTRRVTVRSMKGQAGDWTWLVWVAADDPLLDRRLDVFRSAGHPVVPTFGDYTEGIDWSGDVLTTRIDDDDAFSREAFARLYRAVRGLRRRMVLMFPNGYRVNGETYTPVHHMCNAWVSVFAPRGDRCHVRMRQHRHVPDLAPVKIIDHRPAYLWVRHPDTNSAFRSARHPLTDQVRAPFDVDWSLIESIGGPWPGRPQDREAAA